VTGGQVGLALLAGMLATVNPCGLPMLPVYLSFFVSADGDDERGDHAAGRRALGVAATVAVGFLVVFGAMGMLVSWVSEDLEKAAPWITIVIAIGLVALGVFLLMGKHLVVALPKLDRGGRTRGLWSMFVFGLSYAIASLGCELPLFLVQVSNTFGKNVLDGLFLAIVFAVGMALVLMALSVSLALARTELAAALRRSMRIIDRVSGGFLIVAGIYLVFYGRSEITATTHPGAAVDKVTGWSGSVQTFMQNIGTGRLAGLLVVVIAAAVLIAWLRSDRRATKVGDDAEAQPEATDDSSTPSISSP
jgi:cytochrome c biogenesis protein CcdA